MSGERFYEPRWYQSESHDEWWHFKGGWKEPCTQITDDDIDIRIPSMYLHGLIKALDEQGYIKPRLDERLRTEDLKITHRLLDVIEKLTSK
ncbi:hypothetical protein ACFLXA_02710 [Chloroflexota bacterium]